MRRLRTEAAARIQQRAHAMIECDRGGAGGSSCGPDTRPCIDQTPFLPLQSLSGLELAVKDAPLLELNPLTQCLSLVTDSHTLELAAPGEICKCGRNCVC